MASLLLGQGPQWLRCRCLIVVVKRLWWRGKKSAPVAGSPILPAAASTLPSSLSPGLVLVRILVFVGRLSIV